MDTWRKSVRLINILKIQILLNLFKYTQVISHNLSHTWCNRAPARSLTEEADILKIASRYPRNFWN